MRGVCVCVCVRVYLCMCVWLPPVRGVCRLYTCDDKVGTLLPEVAGIMLCSLPFLTSNRASWKSQAEPTEWGRPGQTAGEAGGAMVTSTAQLLWAEHPHQRSQCPSQRTGRLGSGWGPAGWVLVLSFPGARSFPAPSWRLSSHSVLVLAAWPRQWTGWPLSTHTLRCPPCGVCYF